MNAPKFLYSATAAAAIVGTIGLAYAQTAPMNSDTTPAPSSTTTTTTTTSDPSATTPRSDATLITERDAQADRN